MSVRAIAVAVASPLALLGAVTALPAQAQSQASCGYYYGCPPTAAPATPSREVLAERVVLERLYARSSGVYGDEKRKRSSRRDKDAVVERIVERPVYIDRPVYVDRATGYPVAPPAYGAAPPYGQQAYAPPQPVDGPRPLGPPNGVQSQQVYRQGGGQVQTYQYGSTGAYGSTETQHQGWTSSQQGRGWTPNGPDTRQDGWAPGPDNRYGPGGGWLPRTMESAFGPTPMEQPYARPAY